MRVFKRYAPRQIANYVCAFFKGKFSIAGHGSFCFDGGRVSLPEEEPSTAERISMCREINAVIYAMSAHLRTPVSYS